MASPESCAINLDGLTKEDQKEVSKKIQDIVRRAKQMADISDIDEEIRKSLDDYESFLQAAAKISKANAYRNKVKQQELIDYVLSNWDDNPAEGLMAALVGSQIEKFGARNHTSAKIRQFINRYQSTLRLKLNKENLWNVFHSGQFDREAYNAKLVMDTGGDTSSFSSEAMSIAKIISEIEDMIIADSNRYGGFVRKLEGHMITRTHDMFKIKSDKEGWKAFMYKEVDWDKSFPDMPPDKQEDFLNEQWSEFSTGKHISSVDMGNDSSGLMGFASVAKKMSQSRKIHFKSADAEFEYQSKYGAGKLSDSLWAQLDRRGRQVGFMSSLGPNPVGNFAKVIKSLEKMYNQKSDLKSVAKVEKLKEKEKYIMQNVMPFLTGEASIPGNAIGAAIESTAMTLQRVSLLGASAVTSAIGDSATFAVSVARLEKNMASYFNGLYESFAGLGRNLKDESVQDFFADAGVQNDYQIANIASLGTLDIPGEVMTRVQKRMHAIENKFYLINGQYFWDTRQRASVSIGFATRFGRQINKSYDSLPEGYRRVLSVAGIDSAMWDIARRNNKDFKGNKILSIEDIRYIDDETIDSYIISRGKKPTRFQREYAKNEIINTFRAMFQDQQGYSILAADDRLRAAMMRGTKSGTVLGTPLRLILQLKQYPLSFLQKVLGREIWSNSSNATKSMNVAGILIAATIAGYITILVQDALKGKTPRKFDANLLKDSILRGGGFGIYGDFMNVVINDGVGAGPVEKLLGPTAADISVLLKAASGVAQGDANKAGDNMALFIRDNLPFANIPGIKLAADYLLLNQMRELVSPGSLQRAENRLRRDYDQEYMFGQPSRSMLFE